ncbi:MAG: hypothetical protein L0191_01280, partial [Acidobacteria bacterium]|nr:hypothetical protein [Acidobacteriota bacterium]
MKMVEETHSAHSAHRRLALILRLALLGLLVAAPWPFGSATPRPGATLSAALYVLFGIWAFHLVSSGRFRRYPWTAGPWVAAGLLLALMQLVPLPVG